MTEKSQEDERNAINQAPPPTTNRRTHHRLVVQNGKRHPHKFPYPTALHHSSSSAPQSHSRCCCYSTPSLLSLEILFEFLVVRSFVDDTRDSTRLLHPGGLNDCAESSGSSRSTKEAREIAEGVCERERERNGY